MVIVDTSAWVEYLRRTESAFDLFLDDAVRAGRPIATPASVVMELLAGCRTEPEARQLLKLISRFEILVPDSLGHFQQGALVYRTCRRAGRTIRSMVDCMVAASAIDEGRPLLARNRDFEMIARHTELELVEPESDCER
ncbi:MAG: PIN domain nuclease [Gammaproteobacteria bacterium]|nr:PIN domain nuclease [Gammaproteobacteria bacterium]MYC53873.1 PIN domain nuclease [Gammaproteobacteria bacterium]